MPEPPRNLAGYVAAVAEGTSAPGGGSVAAVVAALAAALGAMVAGLTVGRERYASADEALQRHLARLHALRERMLAAAEADEQAYGAYREAAALPRRGEAEQAARAAAMQAALIAATDVPLDVAGVAAEIAEILGAVARLGNPHLRADAALAALLADAALRGALLNVRGNAALLAKPDLATRYRAEADRLERVGRRAADLTFRIATESPARADTR